MGIVKTAYKRKSGGLSVRRIRKKITKTMREKVS
jgi:hypothetical protein